jgi:hypothetical protein
MKAMRHFLGFMLYLFMAFPLTLGGLSVAALRPLADGPELARSLVTDQRFTTLLESADLVEMAPETISVGAAVLDGRAAVKGFQASIQSAVVVSTAVDAVDSAYAALKRGEAFFEVDAKPAKAAAKSGANTFATVYIENAAPGQSDAGAPVVALPEGTTTNTVVKRQATSEVAKVVTQLADDQPDTWRVGDGTTRFETPAKIGSAMADASVWLLITGAGLCFASVMVTGGTWRSRLGRLGSRILIPSSIVLLIGLLPRLVMPGNLVGLPSGISAAGLPDLMEYLRFAATKLGSGFLTAGLISLATGTVFVSAKRIMPPSEEEEAD